MLIKDLISNTPYSIGRYLKYIPFQLRLGSIYLKSFSLLKEFELMNSEILLEKVISNLNSTKNFVEKNFEFYQSLYSSKEVFGRKITNLNDWKSLPIISKDDLRFSLSQFQGKHKLNTGGTTGEPFSFYVDNHAWAREWAHMHFIWALKGYHYTMPKITLRGKDLGDKLIKFNVIHNEFIVNTYKDFSDRGNALKLADLIKKRKIRFVHGYPSSIYNTFLEMESSLNKNEIDEVKEFLNVALFGSEFPVNYMTEYIEKIWGLDYISWYGHSEMCILAYDEFKNNKYVPFYSYGFPEVVNGELIGSSYHNSDMPLIRYRTGDLVEGEYENGLLKSFSIKEGRYGDFIEDKHGKKIPLTGLIFGRHHKAFETFDYVQIKQLAPGYALIYVTDKRGLFSQSVQSQFDFSNVDVDFTFVKIQNPILSKAGKFKLKI